MKLKLNTEILDIDGKPIPKSEKENLTMADVAVNSLLNFDVSQEADVKMDGNEKFTRFKLANKLTAAKEAVNLSIDELKLIKDLVGKIYPTVIVGFFWKEIGEK